MQNFNIIDEPLDPNSLFYPYYPSKTFYKVEYPVQVVRPIYATREEKSVFLGWETVTEMVTTVGSYTTKEAARRVGQEKLSLWCYDTGRTKLLSEVIRERKEKIRGQKSNEVVVDDVQELNQE